MQFLDLIIKKRNGLRLSKAEIDFFISAYVRGEIADYQVAALLMAICFSRMDDQETAELTFAMRDSGETIDLSDIPGPLADKHSTGGVADTTTLITAPIVAACGLKVAKMSGRGLGHTGGTIDKLESIAGLITAIEMSRFKEIVRSCNLSIIAQTADLVPADKLLYALRDVTGTIDDLSLISASIMSKKLACGSDTIVLDVKTGNGAFMKTKAEAEQLARTMVTIGQMAGKNTMALVTDMNQPLGNAVGNSLEVQEAIEILQGDHHGDLRQLSCQLAAQMLLTSAVAGDQKEADRMVTASIDSAKALKHFAAMIKAQGGDPRVCKDISLLPMADQRISITAPEEGYISEIATDEIGMAAMLLGAGRASKTDIIDPAVGIWLKKRRGDYVARGEQLAVFHINSTSRLEQAKQRFLGSLRFGPEPLVNPLIYSIITPEKGERCNPRP